MSNFESTELSFQNDPKNPDLGCIRKGASDEIDAEILRQLTKSRTESQAGQGLLTAAGVLLGQLGQDKPVTQIKPIEKHPAEAPSEQGTDCVWRLPIPSKEEYLRAERENIAATLDKYFSKIDRDFFFGLGKDGEITREELTDFLVSDKTEELSDHEMADLVKVFRNFDKIKESDRDAGCLITIGITREDLGAYAHAGAVVRKRSSFDASWNASDLLEALSKK